jgi:EAL domain-containing protein (putative c-di-GMP-specific phosphodiesterase class I)
LESDLQQALEDGQLVLHYQPILRLPCRSLAGVEALIRWNHPEHGLIGPEVFLPAAEESGLMQQIGRWVITEACRQSAVWTREGRNMAVSVNISGQQIPEGIPVDWLRETLARFSIDPGALTFDITEKALLQESPALRQWLAAVDEMQIRLALDDFGTGYASISRLRHSSIHQIKIDSSLVRAMQGDLRARSLVKSIIDTGKNMGRKVSRIPRRSPRCKPWDVHRPRVSIWRRRCLLDNCRYSVPETTRSSFVPRGFGISIPKSPVR